MYTFVIHYADGSIIECKHIVSVTYIHRGAASTVSNEAIAATIYEPGKNLWLRSETGSFSIDGAGVRMIEVETE